MASFYAQRRWREAKLTATILKQKALHIACERLTGGDKSVTVGFGDANVNFGRTSRSKVPVKGFRRALER